MRVLPLLVFLFIRSFESVVQAQDDEEFLCGNPDVAEELDVNGSFDTIAADAKCDCHGNFLAPSRIHWHIYAIANGEKAKISMFPEGLVKPFVNSNTLKFHLNNEALNNLSKGDSVEAGINLYIPSNNLKAVNVPGVDEIVEIVNDLSSTELPSLAVKDSGVDNKVYVTSPSAEVSFKGSGVNSFAQIEAGSQSFVDLTGVDQDVSIKTGEGLEVKMTGVDQQLLIEGAYDEIQMTGVNGKVFVNGETRCDVINSSGVDNSCSITEKTVVVETLPCLASASAATWGCGWGASTGGAIAAVVGCLAFVGLIVALIVWCCRSRRSASRSEEAHGTKCGFSEGVVLPSNKLQPVPPATKTPASNIPLDEPIVEAEVIQADDLKGETQDPEAMESNIVYAQTGAGLAETNYIVKK